MALHSTSPSVYLVLSSVRATNLCGAVGSESTQIVTLSFPPNYLYTYAGEVGNLDAPGDQASSALFNPTDLANCTIATTTSFDIGPHFANPCSPFIVAPTQLLNIDPAFSTCKVGAVLRPEVVVWPRRFTDWCACRLQPLDSTIHPQRSLLPSTSPLLPLRLRHLAQVPLPTYPRLQLVLVNKLRIPSFRQSNILHPILRLTLHQMTPRQTALHLTVLHRMILRRTTLRRTIRRQIALRQIVPSQTLL